MNVLKWKTEELELFRFSNSWVLRRSLNSTFGSVMSKAEFKKFFQTL